MAQCGITADGEVKAVWRAMACRTGKKLRRQRRGGGATPAVPGEWAIGRTVHIHPIKPVVKAFGTQCLKLESDEPLSTSGLRSNLRRYTSGRPRPPWHPPPPMTTTKTTSSIWQGSRLNPKHSTLNPKPGRVHVGDTHSTLCSNE